MNTSPKEESEANIWLVNHDGVNVETGQYVT